jgi:hypothetical protein
MKNRLLGILFCSLFTFILIKTVENNLSKVPSQAPIQKAIEPRLLENFDIDSLQKIDTVEQYKQWINQTIDTIWKEIEDVTSVSRKACEAYKIEHYDTYIADTQELLDSFKDLKPLTEECITLIKNVLKDFNVNPDTITIHPFDHFSPAAADDCVLLINEELFQKKSPAAQKFSIAHELQHFIHQDNSLKSALSALSGLDNKILGHDHPINKLSRMIELRADMLASFTGPVYAQGYIDSIKNALEIIGDGKGLTHPKNTLRLTYANHLKTLSV